MVRFCVLLLGLAVMNGGAFAQEGAKFRVDGARLIYDTETVPDGVSSRIDPDDADELLEILQSEEGAITALEVNSTGGSLWAARRMADIILDFELDTIVNGECSSMCMRIFLAGSERSMVRGSRIGFHQSSWNSGSVERYYDSNAEDEGWATPFEFASWIYADTQSEIHEWLTYQVGRGVSGAFAIETIRTPADDMWHPSRSELRAAGVLTR